MGKQVSDSPVSWVAQHMEEYLATGGEKGYYWRPGVPTLLLTTTGRRSGQPRRTALIFGRDGDDYVVIGSKGGSDQHPAWFLNLEANPEVEVQVRDEVFKASARVAEGAERERLWRIMCEIWPAYDEYQVKTDRQIPVVVLSR